MSLNLLISLKKFLEDYEIWINLIVRVSEAINYKGKPKAFLAKLWQFSVFTQSGNKLSML